MGSCGSCCCLCTNRWTPEGWPCSSPGPPGPDCHSLSFIPGITCQDGWKHSGVTRRGRASAQHSSLINTFTSLFPAWAESSLGESQEQTSCSGLRAQGSSSLPGPDRGWGAWRGRRPSSGPGQAGREDGWWGQRAQQQVSLSPPSSHLSLWPRCCFSAVLWTLH